jgi:hypothetical protein
MSAQYANLGGRQFVNEDFVSDVRELYPHSTRKIPFGWSTYTGWTGKDEVLFTRHDAVEGLEGDTYEVTFDPVNPAAFDERILGEIQHVVKSASVPMERQARVPSGLYGYAKSIQASCESASRRLNRRATDLVKKAVARDASVLGFLETHARRGPSLAARVLLGAYGSSLPRPSGTVTAGAVRLGMYGYPAKIARIALTACQALREEAGMLAADLHVRRAGVHAKIVGFLGEHSKTGGCTASGLILSCYPEADFRFRRTATVTDWIAWDESPTT